VGGTDAAGTDEVKTVYIIGIKVAHEVLPEKVKLLLL